METTRPLETVLAISRDGIRLRDIATMELWTVDPTMSAAEVHAQMTRLEFDTAPLDEDPIWRFVALHELVPEDRPVAEVARPIRADELAHESLGLLTAMDGLRSHQSLFVLKDRKVCGVVSRSDVQRPAAAIAALSLILAAEQGLRELFRIYAANDWLDHLKDGRRDEVLRIHESRQREDAVIDLFECLPLADTFDLIAQVPEALEKLGMSKKQFKKSKERLNRARDTLAHAGSLLSVEPDPLRAIELFHEIKDFAELVWGAVGQQGDLGKLVPTPTSG